MAYFDLSPNEHRSFLAVVRHTILEGPLKLVRFSDSQWVKNEKVQSGNFWMYASQVREILTGTSGAGPGGLRFIGEIKQKWAICEDWSDLSRMWVMNIPAGATLNAYIGFAKFQPALSSRHQEFTKLKTDQVLNGGALQIVTRVGAMERHWITGPSMTVGFAASGL